jgi:phenylpropionate dioxygenase-like ring-hydroxylating dioxygenase large terminal subunit
MAAEVEQLTAQTWRPGLIALRDAWFPVAHVAQVGRHTVQRTIHGQPLTLSRRDDGALQADCPVVERYGYAWAWYGNREAADPDLLPDVPYLYRGHGLPRHMWGTIFFDCAYELVCENLLDLTHGNMIHGWLLGDPFSEKDEITVDATSETVTMTRVCINRRTPPSQRAFCRSKSQDVVQVAHVHLRSGVVILSMRTDPPGLTVRLFHPNIPESPQRTRLNYAFICDASPIYRNLFPLVAHAVGRQDNRMLRAQNPRYMEPSGRADCSSRFDAAGLRYRKGMKDLANRQLAGDFAYRDDPALDATDILRVQRVD